MGIFDFFKDVNEDVELNATEQVQFVEDLVRECVIDLAFSRDEVYTSALKDNTVIMVRQGETSIKKFKSGDEGSEAMYISLPASIYDDVKDMSEFDQYHSIMDTVQLSIAASEFRETDEAGELNFLEAEIIDNASKKYEDETGTALDVSGLVEYDDYGQPESVTKSMFEPKTYAAKGDKDEDDDAAEEASESCESAGSGDAGEPGSSGPVSMQQVEDSVQEETKADHALAAEQTYQASYTSQSITDVEQKQVDNIKNSTFHVDDYGDRTILTDKVKVELMRQVEDIKKALKGYDGKTKRINPAKRLSSKDICNDVSEKIYIGKDPTNGRYIDQNLVIDCSGSMGGSPIRDAIKMAFVFNKLAQAGFLEGSIILTETSENMKIDMPAHDQVIESIGGTGGGEGLTKTLNKYVSDLRNKNVLVMTDGDLVEEPIPEKFWDKGRMTCVGMYINESVKAEELPGYDKGMSRWFPRTIIRNSFEEAVNKMIALGLRASKK